MRNGTRPKTVISPTTGPVTIQVPRDRDGTFTPVIVPKRHRRLTHLRGHRRDLGRRAGTGGEGVKFWMSVLTDIKNRGVTDTFILVCDGLKGLDVVGTV